MVQIRPVRSAILLKHDLSCIHSHGTGKEQGRSCFLRWDTYLYSASIGKQLVKVHCGDDKITGAGVGFVCDEIQRERFVGGGI